MDLTELQLMLAGRMLPPVRKDASHLPTRLKLLPGGLVGYDGGTVQADGGKMMVRCRISNQDIDRSRDKVLGKGIDFGNHKKNPIVLLEHNRWCPIARAEDPEGNYTVKVADGETIAESWFFQGMRESEEAFRLIEAGALNGASIGIRPRKVEMKADDAAKPFAVIEESELFEYSHVFMPDNPDALVLAVEKGFGGRQLSPHIREILMPLLPSKNPWSPGWTPAAKHKGDMGQPGAAPPAQPNPPGQQNPQQDADAEPMKAGAQALAGCHEGLMHLADFIDTALKVQEDEDVDEWLKDLQGRIGEQLSTCAGLFNEKYPNLPKLEDPNPKKPDDEDAPGDDEDDLDDEDTDVETPKQKDGDPPPDPKDNDEDDEDDKEQKKVLRLQYRTKLLALLVKHREAITKRASSGHAPVIKEAAGYLRRCAKHSGRWTKSHQDESLNHCKALRKVLKEMDTGQADGQHDEPSDQAKALDLLRVQEALAPLAAKVQGMQQALGQITGKGV